MSEEISIKTFVLMIMTWDVIPGSNGHPVGDPELTNVPFDAISFGISTQGEMHVDYMEVKFDSTTRRRKIFAPKEWVSVDFDIDQFEAAEETNK